MHCCDGKPVKVAVVEIEPTPLLLPPFSILLPTSCLIALLFLSFGLVFLRTVRYVTHSGLSKEQCLWPSFYYVVIPFFSLCLPTLIRLSLSLW